MCLLSKDVKLRKKISKQLVTNCLLVEEEQQAPQRTEAGDEETGRIRGQNRMAGREQTGTSKLIKMEANNPAEQETCVLRT